MSFGKRTVIGDYYEHILMRSFGMKKADASGRLKVPDLKTPDGKIMFEVKASAYDNGGVIKEAQMLHFLDLPSEVFYAVPHHSLTVASRRVTNSTTPSALKRKLDLRLLTIIPLELIAGFYNSREPIHHDSVGDFVQLRESVSRPLIEGDKNTWDKFNSSPDKYDITALHERVYLITNDDSVKTRLQDSFRPHHVNRLSERFDSWM